MLIACSMQSWNTWAINNFSCLPLKWETSVDVFDDMLKDKRRLQVMEQYEESFASTWTQSGRWHPNTQPEGPSCSEQQCRTAALPVPTCCSCRLKLTFWFLFEFCLVSPAGAILQKQSAEQVPCIWRRWVRLKGCRVQKGPFFSDGMHAVTNTGCVHKALIEKNTFTFCEKL